MALPGRTPKELRDLDAQITAARVALSMAWALPPQQRKRAFETAPREVLAAAKAAAAAGHAEAARQLLAEAMRNPPADGNLHDRWATAIGDATRSLDAQAHDEQATNTDVQPTAVTPQFCGGCVAKIGGAGAFCGSCGRRTRSEAQVAEPMTATAPLAVAPATEPVSAEASTQPQVVPAPTSDAPPPAIEDAPTAESPTQADLPPLPLPATASTAGTCRSCGAPAEPGSAFCAECGTTLRADTPTKPVTAPAPASPPSGRSHVPWLVGGAVAVIAILAAALVYVATQGEDSQSPVVAQTVTVPVEPATEDAPPSSAEEVGPSVTRTFSVARIARVLGGSERCSSLTFAGVKYRANIIQCGDSSGARRASGGFAINLAGVTSGKAARITSFSGVAGVDEASDAGADVAEWQVRYGSRIICTAQASKGSPTTCEASELSIPVTAGEPLVITQSVRTSDPRRSLWAGMHAPTVTLEIDDGADVPEVEPQDEPSSTPSRPTVAQARRQNDDAFRLMQAGRYAQALPILERVVPVLAGRGPSDPYEAYSTYNLGATLIELGRCDEALVYLRLSDELQDHPNLDDALLRANSCIAAGEGPPGEDAGRQADVQSVKDAIEGHWNLRASGDDSSLRQAFDYYTGPVRRRAGGENAWVRGIQADGLQELSIHSVEVTSLASSAAQATARLRTVSGAAGCKEWTLDYELVRSSGRWLISDSTSDSSGC
jgi:hypothetical protein